MWTSQSTRNAEIYPAVACGILILIYLIILFFTRIKVNISKRNTIGYVFIFMVFLPLFPISIAPIVLVALAL